MSPDAREGPGRLTKNQRQHLVAKLLGTGTVSGQEQLVGLLADEGCTAAWPTSTARAITSTPSSSIIQRTATEVSRPPL